MLDLVNRIEEQWVEREAKDEMLKVLRDYFVWANFFSVDEPLLKKLGPLEFNISETITLRALLDIAVPMERFLSVAVKDDQMFKVKQGDRASKALPALPLCFVLDHLRSAFNVGSLFRTAECMGVNHIYLVGYTPTPEDSGVQKTAMGTHEMVPWSSHNHLDEVLCLLKASGVSIAGLETAEGSTTLFDFAAPSSLALLVGNERFGLTPETLQRVDHVVEVPMRGRKNSLNVVNSVSMVTCEVVRQWNP